MSCMDLTSILYGGENDLKYTAVKSKTIYMKCHNWNYVFLSLIVTRNSSLPWNPLHSYENLKALLNCNEKCCHASVHLHNHNL